MNDNPTQYSLPKGWITTTLGELCVIHSGGTPNRRNLNFFKGNIPWVKSGELNFNVITETEEHINDQALENSSAKIFPKGSLLVALYGATVGKLAILGIEATTNQAVAAIIPTQSVFNKYIYFFLLHNKEKLLEQRQGGAQPNISQKILIEFNIALPPLNEQYRIVEKIEELFSEMDNARQSLKNAKKLLVGFKSLILRDAFEGKLTSEWRSINKGVVSQGYFFPAIELQQLPKLPDDIAYSRIRDVADVIMGQSPEGSSYNDKGNGTPLVNGPVEFGITPFSFTVMTKWTTKPTKLCKKNDLIICVRGSTTGRQNIAGFDACIGRGVAAIRATTSEQKYLNHFFNYSRRKIFEMGTGTTFPSISQEQLKNFPIPNFSIEEQRQIVNEVEYRLTISENLESVINKSLLKIEIYEHSILKKAFEGKLVEQNTTDESVSELLSKIKLEKMHFIGEQKLIAKNKPKKIKLMESSKTILEVLKAAGQAVSAKEIWLNSLFEKDIDAFYAALKDHIESGEIREVLPRIGNESLLALIENA